MRLQYTTKIIKMQMFFINTYLLIQRTFNETNIQPNQLQNNDIYHVLKKNRHNLGESAEIR